MTNILSYKHVHFLGVGGISMSKLCFFLHQKGIFVTGTDAAFSERLLFLQEAGIDVWTGFLPERTGKPDVCYYSSAISENDTEYLYLRASGVPLHERYELLGEVANLFPTVVSIGGTHGKTTTTAMLSHVLHLQNKKMLTHIGGICDETDLYTGDDYFIGEACEYRKSLLALRSDVSVVLNCEEDHPDTYTSLSEVFDTFDDFLRNTKPSGIKIVNGDSLFYQERQSAFRPITVGFHAENFYRIENVHEIKNGYYGFEMSSFGYPLLSLSLSVAGKYNVPNAAFAAACCLALGIPHDKIETGISSFRGVKRRFEYKGLFLGAAVYSDYAHHPTEIAEALALGDRIREGKNLLCVFQPHTYSRTARFLPKFCSALQRCNTLVIVKEYPAREKPCDGIDALTLFRSVEHPHKKYCASLTEAGSCLCKETAPKDVILLIGAGDIDTLSSILIADKQSPL